MTEATLLRAGERPVLKFERHLQKPVDDVWRAVTDPAEMRAWFPTRIEIDEWKVGAQLTHFFDEHDIDALPGKVLEWDPPRRVSFTWGTDTICFELAPITRWRHDLRAHRGTRAPHAPPETPLGGMPASTNSSWGSPGNHGSRASTATSLFSSPCSALKTVRPTATSIRTAERPSRHRPTPVTRGPSRAGMGTEQAGSALGRWVRIATDILVGVDVPIDGRCAPGFGTVRDAFASNFSERGEVGAGVHVIVDGDVVVDLVGGWVDEDRSRPWRTDTLVDMYSVGKAFLALLALQLVDDGRLASRPADR